MKFTTVLAGTLLFFSIIINKTNASCDDCLTVAQNILYCDSANGSACVTNSISISDTPPSPPLLIDCCDIQQLLIAQCINDCQDPSAVSLVTSYCPYKPPC
ncbi:hypothetical protein RhiirA1_466590 [Rhizophagus irregularis]|uniref:Uncharacterized protein n=2 Tax=Rhizophagus irregularis TaxID=588596 RepID=A0A2I1EBP8_9GLOM|nr:hypothetical protein GLOIN_2v1621425 [Rhizophagus irregularis DAOM 181602=DAOM 197198]PKC61422.1 hypothetical protein RhiirA1_466590 [Rhizophagus irregularis]PKY19533.1 hypothetical protein RhiirB3_432605 [Rhizophagus irregularis]POG69976.1 hypothetical protein GLOIN_2v1621425 [Rhizophagus irregularis DAOM 181602=DAOM 197198]UZO09573.1 hypothetical protein OCT59_029790 [Rhizophagus irregularis]CAB4473875.1 unnamed protein product [Rhizophagus irregularis]|eukprot:XP_025176842.1 hypothetical protein GLOIN_2v1621425 [Rhizophagus irregularis DAOM 181602=DAOM 197198]